MKLQQKMLFPLGAHSFLEEIPAPFPPSLSTASTALPQGMLLTSAAKLSL